MVRPEDDYLEPEFYYSFDEIERYNKSKNIIKTQEKIALRILDLINSKQNINKKKIKLLDLGCGPGHTTLFYKKQGYNIIGLDILDKMLEKAKEKNLNVKKGDIRELIKLFNLKEFDIIVSASAIQWIPLKDIKAVARGVYSILKDNGILIIQFYPKNNKELYKIFRIFQKNKFLGEIIIDNQENPKNKLVFLVLKKSK